MSVSAKLSTIQGIAWKPGLQAIKDSVTFSSFETFRGHLQHDARQNSEETRKKYASLIILRLFPERSIDGINPRAWRMYRDEKILEDLARVTTLESEPVISKFVLEQVIVIPTGSEIDNATVMDFISSEFGSYKQDSFNRIRQAMRHMGFVLQTRDKLTVQPISRPDNAFLILLHARLAPKPCIVRVSDILSANFWKFLGIREEATVRSILHEAEARGLIAKYVVVDQLEQITTRYSYEEYMANAFRL